MATLIIGAAAALGSTATGVGAASLYLATTAFSIASAAYSIYSTLNAPKPPGVEGPRLGDLSVQSSTRGAPLPKVWGSMRLSGNVIHAKKYEVATTETVGGKGFMGGGGGTQTTYSYFADFAISLCEGPITGVRRIWMNNKLWYTAADDASDTQLEASEDNARYGKLYLGTTSQQPDPTLEAIHGAGNVPPYRRTAYIVFTRLPLVNFGNAIPQVSVEVCNTPSTFVAPTALCGGDSSGIFGGTNMVRDPETGRVFFTTFDQGYMRVFDSSMECLAQIGLPGKISNDPISTPCYVPTTREIWGAYNTSAVQPTILVVDPDALTLKTTLAVSHTGSGPAFYNPVRDEVIVHEHSTGAPGAIFNPHTRTITGTVNLFGSGGLCFGSLYLSPHDAIVSWGLDDRIRFVKASDYSLIADLDAAEFATLHNFVSYDPGRDVLYWCCSNHTNLYTIDLSGLPSAPVLGSARTLPVQPQLGMVYVSSTDKIYVRGIIVGEEDFKVLDPDSLAQTSFIANVITSLAVGLFAIDGRRYIISGDRWKVPIRGLLPNSGIPLAEIVEDLCIGAGLLDDDIDVSELNTPIVHGYIRAQPMQATAAISPLMLAYQFDGIESDWLLQFPKRGGSSIATILEDNLGAREEGQEPGAPLVISRQQETDLPTALSVHYREPALHYQQGSQIHRRVYTLSQNTIEIDFPIAISRSVARRLVRTLMNRSWTERTRYQFALGPEYLYLDPGDIVKVESDNATHLVRLDKIEFGAPGLVLAEGVSQRITLLPYEDEKALDLDPSPIYDEDEDEEIELIVPPDEIPDPVLNPVPLTRLVLMDIPMLLDAHNDAGFYYAVAGFAAAGWGGAVLHKSIDAGATYGVWDSMIVPAAIGASTDVLATGPTTIFDRGGSLNVIMIQGTLASATEAAVLNGANLGVIGAHGRWEVIQWATATLEVDGSYTLSNLLRGRKGTEHAVASHAAGDTFVALTASTIDRALGATSEIGLDRYWKGVSFGRTLAETSAQSFVNQAVVLEPYSPAHLEAVDNGDGTWDVSWVRRTRADGEWRDAVDVPLFEETESYSVEVRNAGTPVSAVVVSVPSATVTASAGWTVQVAQISSLVGTGYFSEITL